MTTLLAITMRYAVVLVVVDFAAVARMRLSREKSLNHKMCPGLITGIFFGEPAATFAGVRSDLQAYNKLNNNKRAPPSDVVVQ